MGTKDNTLTFTTGVKCLTCSQGEIVVTYSCSVTNQRDNGIIGPGYKSWSTRTLITEYSCGHCGQVFKPTEANKLEEKSKAHKESVIKELEINA